jgi:glutaredoxin
MLTNIKNLMESLKKLLRGLILGLACFGLLLNVVEFFLSLYGKSLCSASSCKLVDSFVVIPPFIDWPYSPQSFMVFIGVLYFLGLSILIFFALRTGYKFLEWLADFLIIAGITVEGYLLNFQIFGIVKKCSEENVPLLFKFIPIIPKSYACHVCEFCFIVFLIIFTLTLFRFFLRPWVGIGFISFIAVFLIGLVVPPRGFYQLPTEKLVLIYSPQCPHCHKVINFLTQNNITFEKVEEDKVLNILLSLNVKSVPVLIVSSAPNKKEILIGEEKILKFFKVEKSPSSSTNSSKNFNLFEKINACSIFEPSSCAGQNNTSFLNNTFLP